MENLLYLSINLNFIKIDNIWHILEEINKINKEKDVINILNFAKNVYDDIMFIDNILKDLINIYKNHKICNLCNIINVIENFINEINKNINILKTKIFDIGIEYKNSNEEDTNIIVSYMDTVIKKGYIDYDKYKKSFILNIQ